MHSYPITLNLQNRSVVVIGGGKVAYRKVTALVKAKANITIVSPSLFEPLLQIVEANNLQWICDDFQPKYIEDAELIFAATNDYEVNEQIYQAKKKSQWINVVDHPDLCDFHIPATVQRGKLVISVSTGGASPLLARKIKNEIAEQYDDCYEDYVDFLYEARTLIKQYVETEEERRKIFAELLNMEHTNLSKMRHYLQSIMMLED